MCALWSVYGETLDFVPIHMEPGAAIFPGRPQRKHYNPLGTVHGGWFATLLDSSLLSKLAAAEVSRKYMATSDLP